MTDKKLKVALIHDYLREYGGAERVLEQLHEMFPDAPIYTAYYNPKGLGHHAKRIEKWNIKTSWFQKFPFANKLVSPFRVFAPMMFESFDMSEYDVVISSSNIYFAKAVITKPKTIHIGYIHTPPRYLYGYTTTFNYKKHWWTRILGELINHILRVYDFETSQRPDILVANSKNVADRIKKFYRRDSVVIYPPINVDKFSNKTIEIENKDYYLSVGRLVKGKGIDVIVDTFTKLDLPLKVAGIGPELERLKSKAGKSVEFIGEVDDLDLPKLYINAKATVVASEDEDFGIVPVESMAAGTPVIAVKAGGFLETVIPGKTGEFYDEVTTESLSKVLKNFDNKEYHADQIKKHAEIFSTSEFEKKLKKIILTNT